MTSNSSFRRMSHTDKESEGIDSIPPSECSSIRSSSAALPINADAKLALTSYGVLYTDAPTLSASNVVPEDQQTSYLETLMNLINGMIGSGVLSMPRVFLNGGILLATIVTPLIGLLSCYCIHLLLAVNRLAMGATGKPPFDYHEIADYAFLLGPQPLRRFHKTARGIAIGVILATQLGGCCVYYVFIATMLRTFLHNRLGHDHAPSQTTCMYIVLPVLIVTMWIRNYRHISRISTLGNFLQIFGIAVVVYNLFSIPIQSPKRLPAIGDKIPQYFVSTLFIYEGSSVSMSLYRAIRKERQFGSPVGVLNVGVFFIILFYTGVGGFGYLQYGSQTMETITESLPAQPLYDAVQLAYAVVVLGTYPVLLYVPVQITWGWCREWALSRYGWSQSQPEVQRYLLFGELGFRTAIVLVTFGMSIVVPRVELILSLVGALTSSSVAIIIPSVVHTVAFWNRRSSFSERLWLISTNLVIFIIGISALIIGFYSSLMDIIDSYRTV